MADAISAGRVVRVTGPVVDAEFPRGELPEILHALEIDFEVGGDRQTVVCETAQHLGNSKVRAIAMRSTDGLVRGTEVRNTGRPITVPVGPPMKMWSRRTPFLRPASRSSICWSPTFREARSECSGVRGPARQ